MSGVDRYVMRSNVPPFVPRKDDPDKEARLLAISRANGWIDATGRSPISGSTAVKASSGVSRRQLAANDARIKPASYRQSRSENPAPEAAIKTSRTHDSSMPPPPRPASRAEADAQFDQENETGYDPFDTDIEHADATTTISDVDRVDAAQPFDSRLETSTQGYSADQSEYEESLDGGPDDKKQSSTGSSRHANKIDEGDSDDDESTDHGSDINEIQPESDTKLRESLDAEEWNAAYSHIDPTPNTRGKIIKSAIDSPTTQKSLAVRMACHEGQRPIQSTVVVDAPRNLGLKHSMALAKPEIISLPPSNTEQKAFQKQLTRKAPQKADHQPNGWIKSETGGGQPAFHAVQTKQNAAQDAIIAMQPSLQHQEKNQQFPDGGKQQLRRSDEGKPKFADRGREVHSIPTSGKQQNSDPQLGHQAVDAETLQLGHGIPIEGDDAIQDTSMAAALEDQAQMDNPINQTSGAAPKESILLQPNKAEPANKDPRKRPLELDYTREELSGMSYKLLNSESYDHVPKPTGTALPSDLAQASLSDKLRYVYDLKDKEGCAAQRRNVFASLPIEQYEESGDLIIEEFTGLLHRYKEARREKRDAARSLEKEIAQREEQVRNKTNAVERDLTGLKRGAEDVIRGKRS